MSDNNKEENKSKEVFIGARPLGEDQIKKILPTYDIMIDQIKQIRKVAAEQHKSEGTKETNNTLSIFGARGTGKTSAIFTLREHLAENERQNILLDIIEPDNFGENTKIMGSVIGLINDYVKAFLKNIKNNNSHGKHQDFFKNCIYKEHNVLKKCADEVIEYHLYTESQYREILIQNFNDTATHIKKSEYLLTPDIKFKQKFVKLVDELVKAKKDEQQDGDEEPLIFIFIDDIDLKTTKCKELAESILQYANHPNIVTVLSGDYDILGEALTLSLIKDEELVKSRIDYTDKIRDKEIHERKSDLADEYLKKIIPPARRHNMIIWNLETIPEFSFNGKSLLKLLRECLGDSSLFSYKESDGKYVKAIPFAFNIFDNKPRGIVNVFYHLYQLSKQDKEERAIYFRKAKALIDTILLSSTDLVKHQHVIYDQILNWGEEPEKTFIEYGKICSLKEIPIPDSESYEIQEQAEKIIHFKVLILCDLVRHLLDNVQYNELIYRNKKIEIIENYINAMNLNINSQVSFKSLDLWHIVAPIIHNVELSEGLLLLKLIDDNKKQFEYELSEVTRDKNKARLLVVINNWLELLDDKKVFSNLLLKIYDSKESGMSKKNKLESSMIALQEIVSVSQSNLKAKLLYDSLLSIFDSDSNQSKNSVFNDSEGNYNPIYIKPAMENLIKRILSHNNGDEYSYNNKDSAFITVMKKYNEREIVLSSRQKSIINKRIGVLALEIRRTLIDYLKQGGAIFELVDKEKFYTYLQKFRAGEDGVSDTKYSKCKTEIDKYILYKSQDKPTSVNDVKYEYSYDDVKEIYTQLKSLSQNYYVWYGRVEAFSFYNELNECFIFSDDKKFSRYKYIILLLEKYLQRESIDIEDIEGYQIILSRIKKKFEESISFSMKELGADLDVLGMNFREIEMEFKEEGDSNE